jgi:hypothetical protein
MQAMAVCSERRRPNEDVMNIHRLTVVLTMANLAAMIFVVAERRPAMAEGVLPVVRARSFELVDAEGRVRANLNVLPAGTSEHGDRFPETVLLRLITERGRPSVKISTSEEAAGISLAGPSNTEHTYVILESRGTASSLTLKNEDGREQSIRPQFSVER